MTDTKFEVYGVNEEVDLRDLDCVEIPEPDIDRFEIPDEDVVFATLNCPTDPRWSQKLIPIVSEEILYLVQAMSDFKECEIAWYSTTRVDLLKALNKND
jgi:hypothetical protein